MAVARLLALPLGARAVAESHVGPLEAAWMGHQGRGLRVTRHVACGELLLVDRALVVAQSHSLVTATCEALRRCGAKDFEAFRMLCGQRQVMEIPKELHVALGMRAEVCREVDPKEVKAILDSNAHVLDGFNGQQKELSGLFLVASLINHSCRPSAARIFLGDLMFLRAARDLEKGEEVTDGRWVRKGG